MKNIEKLSIIFVITIVLLYVTISNIYSALIEFSKFLFLELDFSIWLLIPMIGVIIFGVTFFALNLINNTQKYFIKVIAFYIFSVLLLLFTNKNIGDWLFSLEEITLMKLTQLDGVIVYSNYFFLSLFLISVIIIPKIAPRSFKY